MTPSSFVSPRLAALAAIAFFLPVVFSLSTDIYVWWLEYFGILFHLAMFMLVPSLIAPEWARAAGYGWLLLDTTVGVLALHGVDPSIIDTIRLGGHIFAGIWIVPAALAGSLPSKVFGGFAGAALFLYTFASPFFPMEALAPASISIIIWLGIIAWQNGADSRSETAPVS